MKGVLDKLNFKSHPDYIALFIVLAGLVWSECCYKFWDDPNRIIVHDVILYYEYLPAALIYKDLSMSFTKKDPAFFRNKVWVEESSVGSTIPKMTMGLAFCYSPFFLAAHVLAEPLGYPADGYSNPYRIALVISSVAYAILGLVFMIRLLRKYFARGSVAVTVLAVGLGTNLYFYTTYDAAMSHAYSFFLFAVFIWLTDAWVEKQTWLNTVFIGLIGGLIFLVRPTNGIIFILLLLWHIDSFTGIIARFKLFLHNFMKIATIVLLAIMVFLPQILYWKYSTGDYFYYSYGDERFFFNDPAFLQGLFSYRKGWLLYTPIMAFSLMGLVVLYFRDRKFFWPVIVFTLLNFYVIWSWWCWWYGGGFGQRALIESYALLSIPFTACSQFLLKKIAVTRIIFLILVSVLIGLNIFQTFQFSKGIIHFDGMTKKAYWDTFIRTKISPAHYEQIELPDYEAAMKGDR